MRKLCKVVKCDKDVYERCLHDCCMSGTDSAECEAAYTAIKCKNGPPATEGARRRLEGATPTLPVRAANGSAGTTTASHYSAGGDFATGAAAASALSGAAVSSAEAGRQKGVGEPTADEWPAVHFSLVTTRTLCMSLCGVVILTAAWLFYMRTRTLSASLGSKAFATNAALADSCEMPQDDGQRGQPAP